MRIASWIFVACTIAAVAGVFLPAAEIRGVAAVTRKASLSLYQITNNRDFVRKLIVGYHKSNGKRMGSALAAALTVPHLGKVRDVLDDVHDATTTLDDISESDAKTLGHVIVATLWIFIGLCVVMGIVVLAEAVNGAYRRKRLIAGAAIALVVAAMGCVIRYALGEAVFEANDEIGREIVELSPGATIIPVAAIGALLAAIALVVMQVMAARATTRSSATRPPG